jgi:hypothetical protein
MSNLQYSVAVRNAQADALETTIGASPILRIFSGPKPANCAAANSGTVLATLTLPADWLSAASGGVKSMLGTWQDTGADSSGTAGHFRIYNNAGTTCHQQGDITVTGGGGVMTVNNLSFAAGQPFQITAYSLTRGNA